MVIVTAQKHVQLSALKRKTANMHIHTLLLDVFIALWATQNQFIYTYDTKGACIEMKLIENINVFF